MHIESHPDKRRTLCLAIFFIGTAVLRPESGFNYFTNAIDVSHGTVEVWTDVDVSTWIPAGATGVILDLVNETPEGSALRHAVRNDGSTDMRQDKLRLSPNGHRYAFCGISAEGVFESYIESAGCKIYLTGYTDQYVSFFTNSVDKTPGSVNTWESIDVSGDGVPAGATGVIIEAFSENSNCRAGIRKTGSTDDRTGAGSLLYSYRLCADLLCGIDAEHTFEGKITHPDGRFALIGYTRSPIVFLTNAVDISLAETGRWTDMNLSGQVPERADGFIFEINNDYNYRRDAAIRKKGSTDDRSANAVIYNNGFTHGACGLDANQTAQGFINESTVDFYLLGYTVPHDPTPPSDIAEIRDGAGPDEDTSYSLRTLAYNWDASSDAESGIAAYQVAAGTAPGTQDLIGWTDAGVQTHVLFEHLALTAGQTLYGSVRATNGQGYESDVTSSDGITIITDPSPPDAVTEVRDGLAADIDATYRTDALSANWNASSDPESGIYRYWAAVGSAPGSTDRLGWTDAGNQTVWTQSGLFLTPGETVYISIRAENQAGLQSAARSSDGILIVPDPTPPNDVAAVHDGLYSDLDQVYTSSVLSGSWNAADDPECGVRRYWIAIGTSAGAADVLDWTDNGAGTFATRTGLALTPETTYFFSVRPENTAGMQGSITTSDGILVLEPAPGGIFIDCPSGTDISDDIQDAADALAVSGGTLYLPEGDFGFSSTVHMNGGISLIGTGKDNTLFRSSGGNFLDINHQGTSGGALRISGIGFYGHNPSDPSQPAQAGIALYNIENFRIDHCYFRSFKYVIHIVSLYDRPDLPQSHGVIDHCSFVRGDESTYQTMYGITDSRVWVPDMKMGTHEATFVEDCFFRGCSHATDAYGGGHYVLRYSQVIDCGSVGGHGPGFDDSGRGTRCTEIYGNLIKKTDNVDYDARWIGMGVRGGGGVAFNNTFEYCRNAVQFTCDSGSLRDEDGDGHYDYPALDQTHDKWLWNNTLISTPVYIQYYGDSAAELILENRDYYLRPPSVMEDGFVYTPYPYPHPLTLGDSAVTNPVLLELRVFLEGAYQSGWLSADLNARIPLQSPHPEDPKTVTLMPPNVTDWVLVQLRTAPEADPAASCSAFLCTDGRVKNMDGKNVNLEFQVPEGFYYVTVRHRNHLAVMSSEPVYLTTQL